LGKIKKERGDIANRSGDKNGMLHNAMMNGERLTRKKEAV
jgi:hypothetical protein